MTITLYTSVEYFEPTEQTETHGVVRNCGGLGVSPTLLVNCSATDFTIINRINFV